MPNALGEGRERGILREASSGEAATSTDGLFGRKACSAAASIGCPRSASSGASKMGRWCTRPNRQALGCALAGCTRTKTAPLRGRFAGCRPTTSGRQPHYGKHAEDMKRGRVPTHNVAIEGPEQAQLANGPAGMEGSTS
jgi:hypothetical protein